jgi:hypothetical protein
MQRLGIRAEVIERCLNHRSGVYRGIAGTYQRDEMLEAKRNAFELWARHVEQLINVPVTGNVTRIRGGKLSAR